MFGLVVAIRDIGGAIHLGDDIVAMRGLEGTCDLQITPAIRQRRFSFSFLSFFGRKVLEHYLFGILA